MKKNTFLALFFLMTLFLSGCGVGLHNNYYATENGYTKERGFSLSPNQERAANIAGAELTLSQAELNRAMIGRMKNNKTGGINEFNLYRGLLINDDMRKTAYIPHPEKSQKVEVLSNTAVFITTFKIPNHLTVYNSYGDYRIFRVDQKGGVYNGQKYDYGLRIYSL